MKTLFNNTYSTQHLYAWQSFYDASRVCRSEHPSHAPYYTFRFIYQPDGTRNFEMTNP